MDRVEQLVIYITPYSIYSGIYAYDLAQTQNKINIQDLNLYNYRLYQLPNQDITGREQFELVDIVRDYMKEFLAGSTATNPRTPEQVHIVYSPTCQSIMPSHTILDLINKQIPNLPSYFSEHEIAYQSTIALKDYAIDKQFHNFQITHLTVRADNISLLYNDGTNFDRYDFDFGIDKVCRFVGAILRQKEDITDIKHYISGNTSSISNLSYHTMIQGHIILDAETSQFILQLLERDIYTQVITLDDLTKLSEKIISSHFECLFDREYIKSDAYIYYASYILLTTCILEKLGVKEIICSPEQALKGYIYHGLLNTGNTLPNIADHLLDWQTQSKNLIIEHASTAYTRSVHLSDISCQIYDPLNHHIFDWGFYEKKLFWLAALTYSHLCTKDIAYQKSFLSKIYTLSKVDINILSAIIYITSIDDMTAQTECLDSMPADHRIIVRYISAMLRLVLACDASGTQSVDKVSMNVAGVHEIHMSISAIARANLSAEHLQINYDKKYFENNFRKTLILSS